MGIKILWEKPESEKFEFREEGTQKLIGKFSYRAGVTQGFANMASALNMSEGGAAGVKASIRLSEHIRKASAYVKMTDRSFEDTCNGVDLIIYQDADYPKFDVRVIIGISPSKNNHKKKFYEGRHRQVICLAHEVDQLREELFGNDKRTYVYQFESKSDPGMDETEDNLD